MALILWPRQKPPIDFSLAHWRRAIAGIVRSVLLGNGCSFARLLDCAFPNGRIELVCMVADSCSRNSFLQAAGDLLGRQNQAELNRENGRQQVVRRQHASAQRCDDHLRSAPTVLSIIYQVCSEQDENVTLAPCCGFRPIN